MLLRDARHRSYKSSPEAAQRSQERSGSRLVRRKGASTNVEETDDSDLRASQSVGDAGLVRPPAELRHEGGGGVNLSRLPHC